MNPALVDWVDFLTKLGFPTSTVIMGVMWWIEHSERVQAAEQHRLEREADREEMRQALRESIESNLSTGAAVSTLTSLLGAPRKGRG